MITNHDQQHRDQHHHDDKTALDDPAPSPGITNTASTVDKTFLKTLSHTHTIAYAHSLIQARTG